MPDASLSRSPPAARPARSQAPGKSRDRRLLASQSGAPAADAGRRPDDQRPTTDDLCVARVSEREREPAIHQYTELRCLEPHIASAPSTRPSSSSSSFYPSTLYTKWVAAENKSLASESSSSSCSLRTPLRKLDIAAAAAAVTAPATCRLLLCLCEDSLLTCLLL